MIVRPKPHPDATYVRLHRNASTKRGDNDQHCLAVGHLSDGIWFGPRATFDFGKAVARTDTKR